jgi:hypothetical protein
MGRRGGATTRQARAVGEVAGVARLVAAVPTVSAGAATRDTTVLALRLTGAGVNVHPVVGAWGAALSATSGYSTRVDMHWKLGKNRKVGHWLCGRPDVNPSKIVYAS